MKPRLVVYPLMKALCAEGLKDVIMAEGLKDVFPDHKRKDTESVKVKNSARLAKTSAPPAQEETTNFHLY